MQANANLHEVASDKAAQFTNYVVCDLQEREERTDGGEREPGFPADGLAVSSSAPMPTWLSAAADIATLLLPSFVSFSS